MTLKLSPETERYIQQSIDRGLYPSATELIDDVVRTLAARDQKKADFNAYLADAAAIGIAEIERGEFVEFDEEGLARHLDEIEARVFEELDRRQSLSR